MIQTIIEALDAAVALNLPVATRHGLAELQNTKGGTMPVVYNGDGSFKPIATDLNGTFSYWRINGAVKDRQADVPGFCTSGFTATFPLRIVTLIDRTICPDVVNAARAASTGARITHTALNQALGAAMVVVSSSGVDADVKKVYQAEFGGASFQMPPPTKALVAIDLVVEVTGRAECFDPCDNVVPFLCALIQRQTWARIQGCLTDAQEAAAIAALCEGGEGCGETLTVNITVNGVLEETLTGLDACADQTYDIDITAS